ncbi:hypothetical protein P7K49_030369, partial [Saguinus oedipus]
THNPTACPPRVNFLSSHKAQLKSCFLNESFPQGISMATRNTLTLNPGHFTNDTLLSRLITYSSRSLVVSEPFRVFGLGTVLVLGNCRQDQGERHLEVSQGKDYKGSRPETQTDAYKDSPSESSPTTIHVPQVSVPAREDA